MAVNVNKVYKAVLSILNKEQRGYLNPDEFNKIATEVQLSLLDNTFLEYNKFITLKKSNRISTGYGDMPTKTHEKIDVFYKEHQFIIDTDYVVDTGIATLPTDIYKTIDISISDTDVERIDKNRLSYINSSPLTVPTTDFPIHYTTSTTAVISPASATAPKIRYIKIPTDPRWGYIVNTTYGTNIYDSNPYIATGLVLNRSLTLPTGSDISLPGYNPSASGNGTTAALATTVAPAGGSGATIKVTSSEDGEPITGATVAAAGSGYSTGDVIEVRMEDMNTDGAIGTTNANLAITLTANDLYSGSTHGSTNVELHASEETNLILGILAYAGVTIKDPSVTQQATQIIQSKEIAKQQ